MKFVLLQRVLLITIISVTSAYAQKLPNVQKESIWAPAKIYIDGKVEEWGNHFLAHNHATNIFYTMANDANNIYLVVRAIKQNTIKKIVQGGITLTISSSGKKDDKNSITVTFPKYDKKNPPFYIILNKIPKTADSIKYKISADSSMNKYNKQLNDRFKII